MEMICLDTAILVEHRRSKDKANTLLFRLSRKFSFAVTTVTVFELWRGDNTGEDVFWNALFSKMTILSFDIECAKIAGKDFLDLQKKGQMIDIEDILIGSVAKQNKLRLATANQKHFSRIVGLELVDLAEV